MFVYRSPETLSDVTVSIPAREIHLTSETPLPVFADIRVYQVNGKCLAVAACAVPIARADEVLPPPATGPAEATVYWFVKPADRVALPILCGPYGSGEEARDSVPAATEPPIRLRGDEQAWFVSIWSPEDPDQIVWCGPCASEQDAWKLKSALKPSAVRETRLEVGRPMPLSVEYGLARRTSPAPWGQLCAGCRTP